mgnify:FL=1
MGVNVGTHIVTDDLWWGYDTGHDVANPSNITRFFPGEPTVNLTAADFTALGIGGSGQSSVGTKTTIGPNHVRIVDIGSNSRMATHITGLTAGTTYTLSNQFRKISGAPTWRYQIQAYNNTSYVSTIKFTNTVEVGIADIDGWQTAKWTFTLPANSNRVLVFFQDGADYATYDHSFEVKNPQLEAKGHASNYVSGTRSDTAGLIDLKRTKAIDLGNVGFTSGQELDFDGSDDKIELGNHLNTLGSLATFDMVFKSYNTSNLYAVMIGWGYGNNNYSSIALGDAAGAYSDESLHVIFNSDALQMYVTGQGNSNFYKDNEYHHLVVTAGVNNYSIWVDGVELSFVFASGSQSTWLPEIVGYNSNITAQVGQRTYGGGSGNFDGEIPVMKVYNRVLTDEEILRNYKAYKNRFGI